MAEFKTTEEVIDNLQSIIDRLSKLNGYEQSIAAQYEKIDKVTKTLEDKMSKELANIRSYGEQIDKQHKELSKLMETIEDQVSQYSKQIDTFIERSNKLNDFANSFEDYMSSTKKLLKSFEYQVEEAKSIQNQLMMQNMLDIILTKAEKLGLNINVQEQNVEDKK